MSHACGHGRRISPPGRSPIVALAIGVIGKTDRVDARLLAEFGQRLRPTQTPRLSAQRQALSAQVTRRRQLVEMPKPETTRLQRTADPEARADIRSLVGLPERRISKIKERMIEIVSAPPPPNLAAIDRRLRSVPGVGPNVAATLVAELPELGTIDRRRIAALAGLAPIARDSGQRAGRRIFGGGRPKVRTMLYLAALHAFRHSPVFGRFRQRLKAAGKPVKAALTATARKLLAVVNTMLAFEVDFIETALPRVQLSTVAGRSGAFQGRLACSGRGQL